MGDVHCQNKGMNQEREPGDPRTGVPSEQKVKESLRMMVKGSPSPSQAWRAAAAAALSQMKGQEECLQGKKIDTPPPHYLMFFTLLRRVLQFLEEFDEVNKC